MFFSEEKNQKTFASGPADRSRPWPASLSLLKEKVFWFFSSEKNGFPP
jgi:hypothetical protein